MVIAANLWVMLGITLLIGFIFGLFVSNAGKHKRRWREEVRLREKLEKERAVLIRDRDSALSHRDARIAELEQSQAAAASTTAPLNLSRDSAVDGRDRLSAITGIDPQDEIRLNEAGYYRYDQIAGLGSSDERALEDRLHRERGSIRDENWREQAKLLAAGNSKEHLERYGASHRVV